MQLTPILRHKEPWRSNARNCTRVTSALSVTTGGDKWDTCTRRKLAAIRDLIFIYYLLLFFMYLFIIYSYLFIYYTFCKFIQVQLTYRLLNLSYIKHWMTCNDYKIYTFYSEQKYSKQKWTCILKTYFQ